MTPRPELLRMAPAPRAPQACPATPPTACGPSLPTAPRQQTRSPTRETQVRMGCWRASRRWLLTACTPHSSASAWTSTREGGAGARRARSTATATVSQADCRLCVLRRRRRPAVPTFTAAHLLDPWLRPLSTLPCSELVEEIIKVKGANYFSVHTPGRWAGGGKTAGGPSLTAPPPCATPQQHPRRACAQCRYCAPSAPLHCSEQASSGAASWTSLTTQSREPSSSYCLSNE